MTNECKPPSSLVRIEQVFAARHIRRALLWQRVPVGRATFDGPFHQPLTHADRLDRSAHGPQLVIVGQFWRVCICAGQPRTANSQAGRVVDITHPSEIGCPAMPEQPLHPRSLFREELLQRPARR